MSRPLDELTSDLSAITPDDFNRDFYGVLDRLRAASEEILELPQPRDAAPALIALLERFPEEDFGAPGPVVGALEEMGGYEELLRESVARKPTSYTVWMVNRILNSRLEESDRANWLALLEGVLRHPEADDAARESATEFLQFQSQR